MVGNSVLLLAGQLGCRMGVLREAGWPGGGPELPAPEGWCDGRVVPRRVIQICAL